jgi:L-threonylcarbamoyladenylate synthase
MARTLALEWPAIADDLARRFWPGPLTIVVRKQPVVPDVVTAGLPTVGLRVPDHPVALALLVECGLPLAAPSANRFSFLSPTTAEHVARGLGDRVDLILDGGPTRVGIESTVISVAGPSPVLLRPGMIGRPAIEEVTGPLAEAPVAVPGEAHPSPGLAPRHYSPSTPLVVVRDGLPADGRGAYLWWHRRLDAAREVRMPAEPQGYAALMYQVLHEADAEGWDWIAVEAPPEMEGWAAIHDRLRRAATRAG